MLLWARADPARYAKTSGSGNLKDTTRIGGMQLTIMSLGDGARNQIFSRVQNLLRVMLQVVASSSLNAGYPGLIPLPCCCVVLVPSCNLE